MWLTSTRLIECSGVLAEPPPGASTIPSVPVPERADESAPAQHHSRMRNSTGSANTRVAHRGSGSFGRRGSGPHADGKKPRIGPCHFRRESSAHGRVQRADCSSGSHRAPDSSLSDEEVRRIGNLNEDPFQLEKAFQDTSDESDATTLFRTVLRRRDPHRRQWRGGAIMRDLRAFDTVNARLIRSKRRRINAETTRARLKTIVSSGSS